MSKLAFHESEKGIQQAIEQFLGYKGYKVMRMNSGKFRVGDNFVRGQEPGTPDLMAFKRWDDYSLSKGDKFPTALVYFIEVKRPGKLPTALQTAKMKELEDFGARCIVATSIEDVEKYL